MTDTTTKRYNFEDKELASKSGKKSSKKGKLHKSTLLKLNLAEHLEDFDKKIYDELMKMLEPVEPTAGRRIKENVEKVLGHKISEATMEELVDAIASKIRYQIVNDIETKKFVVKEMLKYRVPQKREISGNVYGQIIFQAHPDILSGDEEKFANVNTQD